MFYLNVWVAEIHINQQICLAYIVPYNYYTIMCTIDAYRAEKKDQRLSFL